MKKDGIKKPKKDENKKHHCPAYMQNEASTNVESLTSHKDGHSGH